MFKDVFHRAQALAIPRSKKSGKEGKGPAQLRRDLLAKLKGKKQIHRWWKQGQVNKEGKQGQVNKSSFARKDLGLLVGEKLDIISNVQEKYLRSTGFSAPTILSTNFCLLAFTNVDVQLNE